MPAITLFFALILAHALSALGQTDARPEPSSAGSAQTQTASVAPVSPYKLEHGPFTVETIELTLRDKDREKKLPILVRTPVPRGGIKTPQEKFPLVIFSHGMGGSSDAFATLSEHWASHGYVVIHPTHDDSVKLRRAKGEKVTRESFPSAGVRQVDPVGRVKDIVLVLDRLDEIESRVPTLRDRAGTGGIDRERVCMAGHSAGAFTTQMIAGVKMGGRLFRGRAKSFADERIKAFMPISPQGVGRAGMNRESWAAVELPMLAVTGSQDVSPVSDETPESRRHCFEFSKPLGNKHLLWIDGAKHSSFGGKAGDGPALAKAVDTAMKCVTTAFLDANLVQSEGAPRWLAQPRTIADLTDGMATLSTK